MAGSSRFSLVHYRFSDRQVIRLECTYVLEGTLGDLHHAQMVGHSRGHPLNAVTLK